MNNVYQLKRSGFLAQITCLPNSHIRTNMHTFAQTDMHIFIYIFTHNMPVGKRQNGENHAPLLQLKSYFPPLVWLILISINVDTQFMKCSYYLTLHQVVGDLTTSQKSNLFLKRHITSLQLCVRIQIFEKQGTTESL